MDYNSIMRKLINLYHQITHEYAFHIELTTLTNRTYELVSEFESEQRDAQVNLTEVVEDPNQSSEEPKTSFAQEGKPRSIIPYFQLMQFLLLYISMVLCI